MKKLVALLIAMLTILAVAVPAMAADTTMYVIAQPNVNFRKGASTKADLIDRIPYRTPVIQHSTTTVSGVKWSYITYSNKKGYVQSKYLSSEQPIGGSLSKDHPMSANEAFGPNVLKRSQTSYYVKNLQIALKAGTYLSGDADGIFGSKTEAAVRQYQEESGLSVDGKVGSATKAKLWSDYEEVLKKNGVLTM